jgi:hypothetical protein
LRGGMGERHRSQRKSGKTAAIQKRTSGQLIGRPQA